MLACTTRVPGLVATMPAAMEQEHERAAGAWQAEWGTLTGSAAAWARDLLEHLEIGPARMAAAAEGLDGDLTHAAALVDRALAAQSER